jgi:hypothetical protein
MSTAGKAGADFSPFKEIWKRAGDGVYKTTKKFVIWMGRYIYALFIPNLMIYLFLIVFLSPLWGGVVVLYPPLRYFCVNSQEITGLVNSGSNDLNLALQEAAQGINDVLQVLSPVFQIWNIVVDWILWAGIRIYQFFDCTIGQDCEGFLQLFRWVRNVIPFVINIFLIVWRGIGGIFSNITPLSTVGDPSNLTTVAMANGSVFLVAAAFHPESGGYEQHMTRLDQGLPDWMSHRVLITQNFTTEARKRTTYPFGGCGNDPSAVCVDPSNSCVVGSVDACELIMDIVTILAGAEDAFVLFLQIIDLIVNYSLELIYDAVQLFLDVILPFFQWLIGFIGGDLIGYFSDLFSKVEALFTWVGDVWDSFIDLWDNVINTIFDVFGDLIDDLDNFFSDLWDTLTNVLDNLADVFRNILEEIVADLIGQITDIGDLIPSLRNEFRSVPFDVGGMGREPKGDEQHDQGNIHIQIDGSMIGGGGRGGSVSNVVEGGEGKLGDKKRSSSRFGGFDEDFVSHRYNPKINFSSIRDLVYGNLTSGDSYLCREAFRYGFDMYTLARLPALQRIYIVGCLSVEEVTTYKEEYLATKAAMDASSGGGGSRSSNEPTMNSGRFAVRAVRQSLNQTMKRVKSKRAEFQEKTAFLRSSSAFVMEARRQARSSPGRNGQAELFKSNITEVLTDLSSMLQNVTARSMGTRPGVNGMEQLKDRVKRFQTRKDGSEESVIAIRRTWDKLLKKPEVASIADRLHRLSTEDWSLHWIRARYPSVDIEGTPEHHAYRQASRFNDLWDDFGRFLSRQPSAEDIGHYFRKDSGAELHSMLKMSVDGAKMQRLHVRRKMMSGHFHNGARGDPGADFWHFITVGLWETIGEAILNAVNFFLECNPLPQPVGPGGDPNTQVDPVRYCLPYWNPDARLPVDDIRIPFDLLFPSCCPPGFDCPSEYKNIFGQLRFLMRFITKEIPLWWGFLTWIPLFGPFWADLTEFPGGNIPDYAFYCFFTCISEPVLAIGWAVFIAVTVVAWFIPIILVLWLFVTCCCIISFGCCRTVCMPCKICTPRSPKKLAFTRDSRVVRAAISTVPGFGWAEPKGGRGGAVLSLFSGSIIDHLEGDDPFQKMEASSNASTTGASFDHHDDEDYDFVGDDDAYRPSVLDQENASRFHPGSDVRRRPSRQPPATPNSFVLVKSTAAAVAAAAPPPVASPLSPPLTMMAQPAPLLPVHQQQPVAASAAVTLPDFEAKSWQRLSSGQTSSNGSSS